MKSELEKQIALVPQMERTALKKLWTQHFGSAPHPRLRREILIPIICYRIQEKIFGGLKASTLKKLQEIASDAGTSPGSARRKSSQLRAGTRIVREWQDKLHEVTVLRDGYEYAGKQYGSLSEIARLITRTRWSGPAFFGLKKNTSRRSA